MNFNVKTRLQSRELSTPLPLGAISLGINVNSEIWLKRVDKSSIDIFVIMYVHVLILIFYVKGCGKKCDNPNCYSSQLSPPIGIYSLKSILKWIFKNIYLIYIILRPGLSKMEGWGRLQTTESYTKKNKFYLLYLSRIFLSI